MKVLIVDDSSVMRRVVEGALREAGLHLAEVLQASDGKDALAVLERLAAQGQSAHLILCDIHMPQMDGIGFLAERNRRALSPHAVAIMITADPSDPLLLQAAAEGAAGHISKPFTPEQMRARVLSLLHGAARLAGPAGSAVGPADPAGSAWRAVGGAPSAS